MMKQQKIRVAPLLCAALLLGLSAPSALADCPPDYLSRPAAAAVSEQSGQPDYSGPYYPVSVEEYSEAGETRIRKTYQLSLSDDPALIPTGSFTRDGRTYRLLDITQKDEIGVDTKEHTETITQDSSTGEMAEILKVLPAQKNVTTKDGYTGTLLLDHTSIDVSVKGYQTSSKNLSATRTYPSLSDADLSLIPKSVSSGGTQLSLGDVQWSNDGTFFTATATYTGTVSSRYATGYTVKANYTGKVAKTSCEVATYTAVFGCEPASSAPAAETAETAAPEDSAASETAEKLETEKAPEAEDTPRTDRRGRNTEEAPEITSEETAPDTASQKLTDRGNSIIIWICAASCTIGAVGILCLLLQILRSWPRRKRNNRKETVSEPEERRHEET